MLINILVNQYPVHILWMPDKTLGGKTLPSWSVQSRGEDTY